MAQGRIAPFSEEWRQAVQFRISIPALCLKTENLKKHYDGRCREAIPGVAVALNYLTFLVLPQFPNTRTDQWNKWWGMDFFISPLPLHLSPLSLPLLSLLLEDEIEILWRNVIFISVPTFKTPHLLLYIFSTCWMNRRGGDKPSWLRSVGCFFA